jgi:hypothetical protein
VGDHEPPRNLSAAKKMSFGARRASDLIFGTDSPIFPAVYVCEQTNAGSAYFIPANFVFSLRHPLPLGSWWRNGN